MNFISLISLSWKTSPGTWMWVPWSTAHPTLPLPRGAHLRRSPCRTPRLETRTHRPRADPRWASSGAGEPGGEPQQLAWRGARTPAWRWSSLNQGGTCTYAGPVGWRFVNISVISQLSVKTYWGSNRKEYNSQSSNRVFLFFFNFKSCS